MPTFRYKGAPTEAKTYYSVADKEVPCGCSKEEQMAGIVRDVVKEKAGEEPITIPDLYRNVFGKSPYRWSYYETSDAIKDAKRLGYFEASRL